MPFTLGEKLYVAGYCFAGRKEPEQLLPILDAVVAMIRMSTGGMAPIIKTFPLEDGRGGIGETVFRPLVESFLGAGGVVHPPNFLASDSYKVEGLKDKTFILIASCQQFPPDGPIAYLEREVGELTSQLFGILF